MRRASIVLPRTSRLASVRSIRGAAAATTTTKSPPSLLSDEIITVRSSDYNRWLQLAPSCLAGTSLGTYFAIPGVLGPHICRAQGVVAPAASDFLMSSIVPTTAFTSLVAGTLAAALARYSGTIGTRRLGLAGSLLFPAGVYGLPALCTHANAMGAYWASAVTVGGVGFYCIYPQLPPFLATRWFPDRSGLAVSIYFASFGSGMLVASRLMQGFLARFRVAPERLGGLDGDVALTLGEHGERLADVGGVPTEVVLATSRDLLSSGFGGLEEGVYVVGTGSNGVVETMLSMGALSCAALQLAAWGYRLPAGGVYEAGAHEQGLRRQPELPLHSPPAHLRGMTLAEAHQTPNLYLLMASTGFLGVTGLPFLLSGQFMVNDIFGGAQLPAEVIGGAALAFPGMIGASNMVGRLLWGPVSDRVGIGNTLALFGVVSVPSLLALPVATNMVATEPQSALNMFTAASVSTVAVFAGGPVLGAPAVISLFGAREATGIFGRVWFFLPLANVVGASLVTQVRDYSYARHALALTELVPDDAFREAFGAAKADAAEALIASKTVTLPLLLRLLPPGTPDPSPLLYDDAFYTLAGFSTLAFACNVAAFRIAVRPPTASRSS